MACLPPVFLAGSQNSARAGTGTGSPRQPEAPQEPVEVPRCSHPGLNYASEGTASPHLPHPSCSETSQWEPDGDAAGWTGGTACMLSPVRSWGVSVRARTWGPAGSLQRGLWKLHCAQSSGLPLHIREVSECHCTHCDALGGEPWRKDGQCRHAREKPGAAHTRICTHSHTHVHALCAHKHVRAHLQAHTCKHLHTSMCVPACTHVQIPTAKHTC